VRLSLASSWSNTSKTSGSKKNDERALTAAVSRSGDAKEAADDPFIYVVIMAVCMLCFWRNSVIGVVALSTLAAGDGMADRVGRRFGQSIE